MPNLHAILQPIGPPDDACAYAYGGEAVRVRCVWAKICALGREEATRKGALEAAAEARAWRRLTARPWAPLALGPGGRGWPQRRRYRVWLPSLPVDTRAISRLFRIRGRLNFTTFQVEVIK